MVNVSRGYLNQIANNIILLKELSKRKSVVRSEAKNIANLLVSQLNHRDLTPIEKHKLRNTFNLSKFEEITTEDTTENKTAMYLSFLSIKYLCRSCQN
jgi:hypothetical protein